MVYRLLAGWLWLCPFLFRSSFCKVFVGEEGLLLFFFFVGRIWGALLGFSFGFGFFLLFPFPFPFFVFFTFYFIYMRLELFLVQNLLFCQMDGLAGLAAPMFWIMDRTVHKWSVLAFKIREGLLQHLSIHRRPSMQPLISLFPRSPSIL